MSERGTIVTEMRRVVVCTCGQRLHEVRSCYTTSMGGECNYCRTNWQLQLEPGKPLGVTFTQVEFPPDA